MTIFVAPTEPASFKHLGVSSLATEQYGVDFMWQSTLGLVGVQRKQFPSDFLASVHDGRLNREYAMMKSLDLAILMLEGKAVWTTEGKLIRDRNDKRNGWTRGQHRNYLHSVQMRAIHVVHTDSINDSIDYLMDLSVWTDKADHNSLDTRPGPAGSGWATVTNLDYQIHLLTSLPSIGVKTAKAIIAQIGMPFMLSASVEELMSVPGIGKKTAQDIVNVFSNKEREIK